MSDAIGTLGQVSVEYATRADDYEALAIAAADAEATYKHEAAKFKAQRKFDDPKLSAAYLDILADADERIGGELLSNRLQSAAVLDAAQKKLQQLRERIATGRTYAATEREVDKIHAIGVHS